MNKIERIIIVGLILASTGVAAFAVLPSDAQQDMDRFFKAKEFVFNSEWSEARTGLESYLKDFPDGRLRDEAFYWLAQSLDRLARKEKSRESVIHLKKEAVDNLRKLIETYPKSLWRDDALALRVAISSTLVLLGEDSYKPLVDEAIRAKGTNERDIKLQAFNLLAELDSATALPILRRAWTSEPDAEVRFRSLGWLMRFPGPEASEILAKIARTDKDERIRSRAASLVELDRQRQIPVRLRYYVYGSRLLDETLFSKFPEKKILTFSLSRSREGDAQSLLNKAAGILGGKLSKPIGSAKGTLRPAMTVNSAITVNNALDYELWISPEALRTSTDRISGEVRFTHKTSGEKHTASFLVDGKEDKLLAMRSGRNVSLLIFQFVERTASSEEPMALEFFPEEPGEELAGVSNYGRLKANSTIMLDEGVKVQTERTYYGLNDFEKNLIDLENAKAEIPLLSPGEKESRVNEALKIPSKARGIQASFGEPWVLIGDLFYLRDRKKLIGFRSKLINPSREVVAEGLIELEAGAPAGFKVLNGRAVEKNRVVTTAPEERRTRPIYPSIWPGHLGWDVYTTLGRNSTDSKTGTDKHDFGLARAIRSYGGRDWVLIGQIITLRGERKFIARQAALILSDGTIVHGDEIHVSADNPENYTLVKKTP